LFPRIDPLDPSKRLSVPSYVTEFYKILSHLGLGAPFEPSKLIVGRFGGLWSKTIEMAKNEDFRGKYIVDPEDPLYKKALDISTHFLPQPISLKTMIDDWKSKELSGKSAATGLLGMTTAPSYALRSVAGNEAYVQARRIFEGRKIGHEEDKNKNEISRAMYAYQKGDSSKLNKLFEEGKISQQTMKSQIARMRTIKGQLNAGYVPDIVRIVKFRLDVPSALIVYDKATDYEKEMLKPVIYKKIQNLKNSKKGSLYINKWTERANKVLQN
jgi:hypothetical protein